MRRFYSFFVLIFLSYAVFLSYADDFAAIKWDDEDKKCIPEVCDGIKLNEICGFDGNMPADLIRDTHLYDSERARQCFKNKRSVFLGDSSTTETVHDLNVLLAGAAPYQQLVEEYSSKANGHKADKGPFGAFYDFQVPGNPAVHITVDPDVGHRNLSIYIDDYKIAIIHRFNGGGRDLNRNGYGVPAMLDDDNIESLLCLLGIPATPDPKCPTPAIIYYQSGHHDAVHVTETIQSLPRLFDYLKEAQSKGSAVYWRTSIDAGIRANETHQIDTVAEELCHTHNFTFLNMTIPRSQYVQYIDFWAEFPLAEGQLPHVGFIRKVGYCPGLRYSSWMTQYIIRQMCQ